MSTNVGQVGIPNPPNSPEELLHWARSLTLAVQEMFRVLAYRTDEMIMSGPTSQRPEPTGSHRFYFDTDINTLYYDVGTWVAVLTNGDSHDHSGGDGAQIDHAGLKNLLSGDPHTQYINNTRHDTPDRHGDAVLFSTPWQSYTSTITGWVTDTASIYYKKIGKIVLVSFVIDATSDDTVATFTVPYTSASNPSPHLTTAIRTCNNGSWDAALGHAELAASGNTVTCVRSGGAWANSGRKVVRGQFWYEAAS